MENQEPPVENNFLHIQAQMSRALKAWVYWQHQHVVRKNKKKIIRYILPRTWQKHQQSS